MRSAPILFALAATVVPVAAVAAPSIEIKDAVARVIVVPEARDDIRVDIVGKNPALPLKITVNGDKVVVDGDLERRVQACRGEGEGASVRVDRQGEIAYRDMPQLVVRTPRDVQISASGAVYGVIGRSASIDLAKGGCGDWTIANVIGKLKISQAGAGETRIGQIGEGHLRVAGSGSIRTAAVRNGLKVDIAGSGDVASASVSGPYTISIAGSGDVRAAAGRVTEMTVNIAGSGDIDFRGVADKLKARIAGAGDIRVREVRGETSRAVMGSGKVIIG